MTDVPVIISRKEARSKGLTRYYTGKPCKRNHISTRGTSSAACTECLKINYHKHYYSDLDESRAKNRKRQRTWHSIDSNMKIKNARNIIRQKNLRKRMFPGYNKVIEQIYINCPDGYQVDHIDPINANDRSGLHTPWNLQYLPASENAKKGNKTDYVCEGAISIDWKQYV